MNEPGGKSRAVVAVLSIAGLDPSAGAGLLADTRVFESHGLYGTGVITAVTAQNTHGVSAVEPVGAAILRSQLTTLTEDIAPLVTKTGMLASGELAEIVAESAAAGRLGRLVIDPVLASTGGHILGDDTLVPVLREQLIPASDLVTPNIHEAEMLTGSKIDDLDAAASACESLLEMGAGGVCITGGHWPGDPVDIFMDAVGMKLLKGPRVQGQVHGSGCCFSAAVVARLALGDAMADAVVAAKTFTRDAIATGAAPGSGLPVPWCTSAFESGGGRV